MIFLPYACSTMCLSVGLGTGRGDVWCEGWPDSWSDPPQTHTHIHTHTNTAPQLCVKVTVVWGGEQQGLQTTCQPRCSENPQFCFERSSRTTLSMKT